MTLPENTSITSRVLFPSAETNRRLRFASAVKWSSRPATFGTGISSSSCRAESSRVCCIVADDLGLFVAMNMNAAETIAHMASSFFMFFSPERLQYDSAPTKNQSTDAARTLKLRQVRYRSQAPPHNNDRVRQTRTTCRLRAAWE